MMKNEKIYVIGDSHVSVFFGRNKMIPIYEHGRSPSSFSFFEIFRVGPGLAYNLINKNSSTQSGAKTLEIINNLPEKSKVILSFGEIDCRNHILKQSKKQNKNIDLIIEECVERYLDFIEIINNRNLDLYILSVVPSRRENLEKINSIKEKFNKKLSRRLEDKKINFLDISKSIKNNLNNKQLYMDNLHLSVFGFVEILNELLNLGIINFSQKREVLNMMRFRLFFGRYTIKLSFYIKRIINLITHIFKIAFRK